MTDHPAWVQNIQKLNDLLHQEPIASLAYGFYWYLLLLISCPILAFASIFGSAYNLLYHYFLHKEIQPKPNQELAVVITGCDSGFGKELVFSLVSKGFVVFAACLQEESFSHFQGESKIHPIRVDVCKEDEVLKARDTVSAWLQEDPEKRFLHALVNNAGTGVAALTDWMKVSDFERIMNVNFFGPLRCVNAFLPLFKQQVKTGKYKDARIVNMVSTAGIVAGGILSNAYECSKHALETYTTNLRAELRPLSIKVVGLNPSLHKTPLAEGKNIAAGMKKIWDEMTPEHKAEYGEEYFQEVWSIFENSTGKFNWDMRHVVEAMDEAVVAANPFSKYLVGMDAKYFMDPASKFPSSWRINFIRTKPAMLEKTK